MKNLIKKITLFSVLFFSKPDFLVSQVPLNMTPTGAKVFSDHAVLDYSVNQNAKIVTTNDPKISAMITDLSDAMHESQRDLFRAYGLIPVMVTIENRADTPINVSPDVLDYGVGLSLDKVKDAIIKNFKLKKYGTQASVIAYQLFILAAVTMVLVYFPYSSIYSCLGYIADSNVLSICANWFSQTSVMIKFLTSSLLALLSIEYLNPATFAKISHSLIDKYNSIESFFKMPSANISELERAIDLVITESGKKDFEIKPNSMGNFMVFVRSKDCNDIKGEYTTNTGENVQRKRLIPRLNFRYKFVYEQ
jgi:hypothetical protein